MDRHDRGFNGDENIWPNNDVASWWSASSAGQPGARGDKQRVTCELRPQDPP